MKLNEIYMRDPFMYIEDGIGYLIGTTDTTAWGGKASGFLGYKTKDMENFEGPYVLFSNNDSFWADENFWAPELHKIFGKFYWSSKGLKREVDVQLFNSDYDKLPLKEYEIPNTNIRLKYDSQFDYVIGGKTKTHEKGSKLYTL